MTKTAAVPGALLMAALAAGAIAGISGCAAAGTSQPRASVAACTEYGSWAIEHRVRVTRIPGPCQGLSGQEVNQAVVTAISRAAAGGGKAAERHRAAEVAPYLADLLSPAAAAASPAPAGPPWQPSASRQAPAARSGRDLAMDVAALAAWLITAGSGAYVLARWIAHGGTLRGPGRQGVRGSRGGADDAGRWPRPAGRAEPNLATASTGVPPPVILGHVGLGLTGLAFWILYLITGWAALAWTSVIVLLPVAGLGMAVLTVGLPGRGGRRTPALARGGSPGAGLAAGASGTRLAPFLIAGHGLLAACTMLVVLLAALGPSAI